MAKRITITSQQLNSNKKVNSTITKQETPTTQAISERTTGLVVMQPAIEEVQAQPVKKDLPDNLKDGRFVLLSDLPSHYRFYEFKELFIRPFTTNEAKLIYMAKKSNNLIYVINAVNACISEDVSKLVVQDFEFCLYWLRLNSYPKKPFKVEWTCFKEIVVQEHTLEEGQELGQEVECKQKNLSTLAMTNMTINDFPDNIVIPANLMVPIMAPFEEAYDINKELSRLETVYSKEELDEDDYETQKVEIEGRIYTASLAQWIKEGSSLEEKIAILEAQQDLELQDTIEELIDNCANFGITETIEIKCQKCGGISRRRLEVDYISFFP